jgi:hypothetical protein
MIFVFPLCNIYSSHPDKIDSPSSYSTSVARLSQASPAPLLSSESREEIERISHSLHNHTSPQDIILFLNPLAYLVAECWKNYKTENKLLYFKVNYSDEQPHTKSTWFNLMEEAQRRNHFEKHLSQLGVLHALHHLKGNLIVVDVYDNQNKYRIKRFYQTLDLILERNVRRVLSQFQFYPLIDQSLPLRETVSHLNELVLDSFCSKKACYIPINSEALSQQPVKNLKPSTTKEPLASNNVSAYKVIKYIFRKVAERFKRKTVSPIKYRQPLLHRESGLDLQANPQL